MKGLNFAFEILVTSFSGLALLSLLGLLLPWRYRDGLEFFYLGIWLLLLIGVGLIRYRARRDHFRRLSAHLRYGPAAVWLFSLIAILSFDAGMIQYSKYQLRSYIWENSVPGPEGFLLHSDYRSWCGNGASARQYSLYGDTAAQGFSSRDPEVRARSLRASIRVYDWLNGVTDGPFPDLIRRAQKDENHVVREIADKFVRSHSRFQISNSE